MRMELRRLTGEVIGNLPWPGQVGSTQEVKAQAKAALAGFYEGDDRLFWPKQRFASNAPEEIRIVSDGGDIVATYTVNDMAEDTKRSLAERKSP
jgi:hypothetical protein